jgi:hypothetical protein
MAFWSVSNIVQRNKLGEGDAEKDIEDSKITLNILLKT